ncbi:MAG: T9SS type A sorting domain-containing protein [Bacteroidales bacterium]
MTFSSTSQNDFVFDSFEYSSVNGSGRLVIWEITPYESTNISKNSYLSISDFTIYPNPNHGSFYIETRDKSVAIFSIKIINTTGQIVYEYNFENPHYKQNLETNLPTGFYNILLNTNKGFYSTKMIVSKQK